MFTLHVPITAAIYTTNGQSRQPQRKSVSLWDDVGYQFPIL